jgi:ABC-type multidrug transport system fused ATPase/permease subunit
MDEDRIKFIEDKIQEYINFYKKRREWNRFLSFTVKLLVAIFAVAITAILGFTFEGKSGNILKNIALILGALITVINTLDMFINHKGLWIHHTNAMMEVLILKNELAYLKVKKPSEMTPADLDEIFNKLQDIILRANSDWKDIRKKENNII